MRKVVLSFCLLLVAVVCTGQLAAAQTVVHPFALPCVTGQVSTNLGVPCTVGSQTITLLSYKPINQGGAVAINPNQVFIAPGSACGCLTLSAGAGWIATAGQVNGFVIELQVSSSSGSATGLLGGFTRGATSGGVEVRESAADSTNSPLATGNLFLQYFANCGTTCKTIDSSGFPTGTKFPVTLTYTATANGNGDNGSFTTLQVGTR